MSAKDKFGDFEKSTGVVFVDKSLLRQAFVHRSYVNEHRSAGLLHNERLEFLGDAVLELVVTEYLFSRFSEKTEGELTALRAALVNTTTLSSVSKNLGMNEYLLLSRGEAKDTGRARQYILANTFEAFIGALYLDQGFGGARDFVANNLLPLLDTILSERSWVDAKSHFQEMAQEKMGTTPSYQILAESGPDHDKHFRVGVFVGREKVAEGEGKSKQEAEQDAAKEGLVVKHW